MAFLTGSCRVQSNQREMRYIMVKPHFLAPPPVIVAVLAELTLLTLMYIIIFMAIVTSHADLYLIWIALMASATRGIFMFATQFEFGLIVIEFGFLPITGVMAGLTFDAILAFMHIIRLMTGYAGQLKFYFKSIFLVAGTAGNIGMFTGQRKLSVLVVIKTHLFPVPRGMAFFAILAIGTGMHIVQAMTAKTVFGGFGIAFIGVTGNA